MLNNFFRIICWQDLLLILVREVEVPSRCWAQLWELCSVGGAFPGSTFSGIYEKEGRNWGGAPASFLLGAAAWVITKVAMPLVQATIVSPLDSRHSLPLASPAGPSDLFSNLFSKQSQSDLYKWKLGCDSPLFKMTFHCSLAWFHGPTWSRPYPSSPSLSSLTFSPSPSCTDLLSIP